MRRAMTLGASCRLRIRTGACQVLAVLLLLAGVSTPTAAQLRLPLHTRSAPGNPPNKLPLGTQLRIYVDSVTSGNRGRNVPFDSVPPAGRSVSSDSVGGEVGQSDSTYQQAPKRYLVIARLPDHKTLLWSVDPRHPDSTRYHTLDGNSILLAGIPERHQNRITPLFSVNPPPPPRDSAFCVNVIPPDKIPWGWIVVALVVVMIGGGLAGWFAKDRIGKPFRSARHVSHDTQRADRMKPRSSEMRSDEPNGAADPFPRHVVDPQLEVLKSDICEHVTSQIKIQLGGLLGEIERRDREKAVTPPPPPTPPTDDLYPGLQQVVLPGSTSAKERDVTAEATAVFLSWCQTAGGNVSRMRDFAEVMQARVANSEVQVLSRDRDNNAITFVSGGAGDPIEYWMVTVPHASMLFPRPLNTQRFRELHPVYEGQAEPQSLRAIVPALVRPSGQSWVLERSGRVA